MEQKLKFQLVFGRLGSLEFMNFFTFYNFFEYHLRLYKMDKNDVLNTYIVLYHKLLIF